MGYHILHQFDEQSLADVTEVAPEKNIRKGFLDYFDDDHRPGRHAKLGARESKRWAVVAAAILLSAFALLLSIDANRRAESLQQRLDAFEARARR